MKSCADVRDNISAYVDNELGIDERTSFEEHIKSCPECKSELDEMLRIIGICSSMPMQPLPEDFRAELHEKLVAVAARSYNAAGAGNPKKIPFARTFASIAAGILLIFLGGSIVRYGLLSGRFSGNKSADNGLMLAEAPAAAQAKTASEGGSSIAFDEGADGSGAIDAQAAEGAADAEADAGESEIMEYGIMESNQSFSMPRSYDVKRSASFITRDDLSGEAETAYSKSSEITIMAEDPSAAVDTVTTLASANNGTKAADDGAYTAFADDTAEINNAAGGSEMRIQLQLVFTEQDFNVFTAALNDTFGAANVQIGAFVTEDRTDMLNMLIDQTNIYDNNIRELQNDTGDNTKEINKLKKEKEEIDKQIEIIRLNSDFVTVTVYVNQK